MSGFNQAKSKEENMLHVFSICGSTWEEDMEED